MAIDPLTAARAVHAMVMTGRPPSLADLARALDTLVLAVQQVGDLPGDGFPGHEAAVSGYQEIRAVIGPRFPAFGYYGVADPLAVPGEAMTGDAIDDLADIVLEIGEALWRLEHVGRDDAVRHLVTSYGHHWGKHARELGLYLHALRFR